MIHIKKSKKTGQFHVVTSSINGEVLKVSESLKSKQSAWKNIYSDWVNNYNLDSHGLWVQDETGKKFQLYILKHNKEKFPQQTEEFIICNIKL